MKKYIKKKIISILIVIGLLISPISYSNSYAQWFGGKVIKYGSIMAFTGLTALLINHYSQKINPLKDIITIDTEKIKESYQRLINDLDYRNKTLSVIKEEIKKNQGKTINIKGKQVPIDKTLQLIHNHINNLPKPNNNLPNIPPEIDKNNSPLVVKDNDNKEDNIISYPLEDLDLPNYIYTPYGSKIDTSTEFPIERPVDWEDYLILKQNSKILEEDMEANGMGKKPKDFAAHHIIPATMKLAEEARKILANLGIDINSSVNGVYLPTKLNIGGGLKHKGKHPDIYADTINKIIQEIDNKKINDSQKTIEITNTLKDLRTILENPNSNSKTWLEITNQIKNKYQV